MDAYEATRIVFSRVQNLDPENAAKIMGLLLIQDHGEKEMIRLAFGPEALLHSVVVKARKDLGLLPSSSPATPSGAGVGIFSRQNSARFHPTSPFSWAAAVPFSVVEDFSQPEELPPPSPAYGGGDLIGDFKLQDQLSFLDDGGGGAPIRAKSGDHFYPEIAGDCRSPSSGGENMLLHNSIGWGPNRRCGSIADLCLSSSDPSCGGFGWRPCLYFARGYCKNGNACRFFHDEATAASGKMDAVFDQDLLLRSKSSRLMAFAAPIPYPPTSTVPPSPSSPAKYMNFLLQHQNDSQRAAAAAATAAALMLGGAGNEELHKFMGRPRADFAGMSNAGSRQIYLTFPADSSFREEDVSNYFSIYGPVQDVRIPYQQKRMFGFVTFVYPETVKLILAKGNPHFVCDARVLVKPYKEKGKVLDKYRKQPQPQPERLSFSGCSTLTDLDSPFDLGGKMSYNIDSVGNMGDPAQDASLLRRLMEQQQAELLQQAIDLQGRRFELMDLNTRNFASAALQNTPSTATLMATMASFPCNGMSSPVEGKSSNSAEMPVISADDKEETAGELSPKEITHFQESTEHNLPDSPFASPTEASSFSDHPFSVPTAGFGVSTKDPIGTPLLPPSSALSSCFFQMPARFSSGHGAVGM